MSLSVEREKLTKSLKGHYVVLKKKLKLRMLIFTI